MSRTALLCAAAPVAAAIALAVYAWTVERRARIAVAKWRHPTNARTVIELDRHRRQSGG